METAPTLHPARVNGTHVPARSTLVREHIKGRIGTGLTKSVQYVNDVVNVEPERDAG